MDGFRDKVDAATRGLKDAKVKVKTEFDRNGDLIHDLDRAMEDAGGRAKAIEPKIKPKIDEANFQAQLRAVKAQAKLSDTKLNIDFDDKRAEGKLEAEIEKLKAIAKAQAIKVRVETEHRERGGFLSNLGGAAGNFKFPDIVPNIGGLGAFGSIGVIVAGLSLLAPALALVSQAIIGLPALVSGVVLPLGVFALGFKGIKQALDDSGILKETQAFDKHGKPKGKPKEGLGPVLSDLQKQVSDVFATGLKPVFQQIAGVIPQLTRGLPFVAEGLVHLAQGLGNILSTPALTGGFDRFTNSVSTMLTNLSPALQLFTSAMSNLVFNVGDHLPGFANTMTEWAGEFQSWVDRISKPKKFWGKDTPNSSELDTAITNIKPVLNSVKDFVGGLVADGVRLANDPNLIRGISDFITGLQNLAEQVARMAPVFEGLAFILGKIPAAPAGSTVKDPKTGQPVPAPPPVPVKPLVDGAPVPKSGSDLVNQFMDKFHIPKLSDMLGVFGWIKDRIGPGLSGVANGAPIPFNPGTKVQQPTVQAPTGDGGAGGLGSKVTNQLQSVKAAVGPALAGIADGSDKVWDKLVEATKAAGTAIVSQVQAWVGQIQGALAGLGPAGEAAGQALSTGMAAGIAAGASSAIAAATALAQGVENATKGALGIHSPSKVFHGLGQNTAQGFQDGLEGGFQGVVDSTKNLAQQMADAMKQGTAGASNQFGAQVQDQLKAITVEQDQLRAQSDGTTDKGQKKAIQGQMDQLNVAKDQLKAQSSQLGYSEKYGDSQANSTKQQQAQLDLQEQQLKSQYDATTDKSQREKLKVQMDQIKAQKDQLKLQGDGKDGANKTDQITQGLGQSVNKMVDIGKNFAMANVNQFENDIGISGHGAIPTIANIGLDWATSMIGNLASGMIGGGKSGGNTHIHVNSIDEGLAAKQTLENRQALTNNAGR